MTMTKTIGEKAVVVLSGGQDSTTCLYWAKSRFGEVCAVSFDYGQRHMMELESARTVAAMAGARHEILDARFINKLAPSALTRREIAVAVPENGLPTTFVPGRNLFFLSMAAIYAQVRGIGHLVTGVCQTDYSGYPDCRRTFVDFLEETIAFATEKRIEVHTPLMRMTKAETVELAWSLPGCVDALAYTHTCYEGKFPPCEKCPACLLRAKGFAAAGLIDPLVKRAFS